MNKYQLAVAIAGILFIFLIYNLPMTKGKSESELKPDLHKFDRTAEDEMAIASLKSIIENGESENYINFADSLSRYYIKYGMPDSAAPIVKKYLEKDSSLYALKKAAPILYTVFERSTNSQQMLANGSDARIVLEKILKMEPDNLTIKTRLAMTLISAKNPMAGIEMLREVVKEEPNHREAVLNLGLLAIQSGQFDKGVERFEHLLDLDSIDYESILYLGICYKELGQQALSREKFKQVVDSKDADTALRSAAQEYLEN